MAAAASFAHAQVFQILGFRLFPMSRQGNLSSLQVETAEAKWIEAMKQDVKDFKEGKLQLPFQFVLEKMCRSALNWSPRRALRVRDTVYMLQDEIASIGTMRVPWGTAEQRRSNARMRAALLVEYTLSKNPTTAHGLTESMESPGSEFHDLCSPCEVCSKLTCSWCEGCNDEDAIVCVECDLVGFQVCRQCVKEGKSNPRPRGLCPCLYKREDYAEPATVTDYVAPNPQHPKSEWLPEADPDCRVS